RRARGTTHQPRNRVSIPAERDPRQYDRVENRDDEHPQQLATQRVTHRALHRKRRARSSMRRPQMRFHVFREPISVDSKVGRRRLAWCPYHQWPPDRFWKLAATSVEDHLDRVDALLARKPGARKDR